MHSSIALAAAPVLLSLLACGASLLQELCTVNSLSDLTAAAQNRERKTANKE